MRELCKESLSTQLQFVFLMLSHSVSRGPRPNSQKKQIIIASFNWNYDNSHKLPSVLYTRQAKKNRNRIRALGTPAEGKWYILCKYGGVFF